MGFSNPWPAPGIPVYTAELGAILKLPKGSSVIDEKGTFKEFKIDDRRPVHGHRKRVKLSGFMRRKAIEATRLAQQQTNAAPPPKHYTVCNHLYATDCPSHGKFDVCCQKQQLQLTTLVLDGYFNCSATSVCSPSETVFPKTSRVKSVAAVEPRVTQLDYASTSRAREEKHNGTRNKKEKENKKKKEEKENKKKKEKDSKEKEKKKQPETSVAVALVPPLLEKEIDTPPPAASSVDPAPGPHVEPEKKEQYSLSEAEAQCTVVQDVYWRVAEADFEKSWMEAFSIFVGLSKERPNAGVVPLFDLDVKIMQVNGHFLKKWLPVVGCAKVPGRLKHAYVNKFGSFYNAKVRGPIYRNVLPHLINHPDMVTRSVFYADGALAPNLMCRIKSILTLMPYYKHLTSTPQVIDTTCHLAANLIILRGVHDHFAAPTKCVRSVHFRR